MHSENKELVRAGRAFADALSHETSIVEVEKMIYRLVNKLDVTNAAVTQALKERDALAADNTYLLPKAASELSNAWMLHKYWVGIQVALMHMRVGRLTSAEEWLIGTVSGPGIEAPDLKLLPEIEAWATEQQKDSIGHDRALEIIKSEIPATDAAIAEIQARGVEMFAGSLRAVGGHAHPYSAVAIEFAAQLRKEAGK